MLDNTATAGAERRRFYRITDEVALSYRVLSEQDLATALERLRQGKPDRITLASAFAATSTQMKHGLDKVRRQVPDVAQYLESLNEKLDLLIRMLAAADTGLPDQPTHNVDLSASGLSFDTSTALPVGSALEIKLLVFPSYVCILTFATVVRCEPQNSGDEYPYRVGVEFSYIRDNERELLIRHVLQKQSSKLRETRSGQGEERLG